MRLLALALLAASVVASAQGPVEDVMVHNHQPLVLPEGYLQPQLEILLHDDESNGFNLQVVVKNYQLESPMLAGDAPEGVAEGHAHLMINGKKRLRVYGEWLHLDKSLFRPGINQVTLTLNSHDHYTWVIDRQPVLATVFVDPALDPAVQHTFASHPLKN